MSPSLASWVAVACCTLLACANAFAGVLAETSRHSSTDYCSGKVNFNATVQDRLLRFAAAAQQQLDKTGQPIALVARSGLDLQRFGHRYSHAGVSLREGADVTWAVRQLYYACDERRPRLFDQGLPGFVFGTDNSETSFLSITVLPVGSLQSALLAASLDKALATSLVSDRYSANAHAFSTQYQNCNQWLVELMGLAWSPRLDSQPPRHAAQQALQRLGFEPEPTVVNSHWVMWAASLVPLLHLDDHPEADRQSLRLRVSMPSNIEHFVRQREPGAQRIEMCQTAGRIVIRNGWRPLPDTCTPEAGDEVQLLD